MAHYDGVAGVARKDTKQYDGVSGVARKTKKAYDGVDGVARLSYTGLYTWAKYTSYVASYAYGDYTYERDRLRNTIWPLTKAMTLDYFEYLGTGSNGIEGRFVVYNDMSYSHSTGEFTLSGRHYYYVNENNQISYDEAEENLAGRFVWSGGFVRFILGYEGFDESAVYELNVGEVYYPGDEIYTYAYRYVEDVQSDDPNAYPEGSTAGYTSLSSNDIRTVYVRVERD